MRYYAFTGALMLTLSATSAPAVAQKLMSSAEKAACTATGGRVAKAGLLGHDTCVRQMPDAGKQCTDGTQCKAGACFFDERKKRPKYGRRAAGICPATNFGFGCGTRIERGIVQLTLCTD